MSDSPNGVTASATELIGYRHDARALNLRVSPGARSILAGGHASRFRGRGMDFSESRMYQPGDDVRHMDWRVTARTGVPHTKLYVEERERPVFLAVDFSPSAFFGTRDAFKSVTAARAASLLAWAAIQQGDRVGAVFATSDHIYDLKPKGGRRGALAIVNALTRATVAPSQSSSSRPLLHDTLEHLASVVHPGSLVLLMSDFYQSGPTHEKLLTRIRQHNDIVAFMLADPLEMQAPTAGRYTITDGLSRSVIDTRRPQMRQKYHELFMQRQQAVSALATRLDFTLIMLENGQDVPTILQRAFGKNRRRPRR